MGTKKRNRPCWTLAATTLLAGFLIVAIAETGRIEAAELQEGSHFPGIGAEHNCGHRKCYDTKRLKRQDATGEAAPAEGAPAEAPAEGAPAEAPAGEAATGGAPAGEGAAGGAPAEGSGAKPVEGGAAAGNGTGTDPLSGQDLPLPPPKQKMPGLPETFPYPSISVVQEPPVPTRPRKKPGFIGGFPGSEPTYPAPAPIPEVISVPEVVIAEPSPEPVPAPEPGPVPEVLPQPEPTPGPVIEPPQAGGNFRPQDWRFAATPRIHQKCTTKKMCKAPPVMPNPVEPGGGPGSVGEPNPINTGEQAWNKAVEKTESEIGRQETATEASAGHVIGTVVLVGATFLLHAII